MLFDFQDESRNFQIWAAEDPNALNVVRSAKLKHDAIHPNTLQVLVTLVLFF